MAAQRKRLSDGNWHFQQGPIDLVIGANGSAMAVEAAHDVAWCRFTSVLDELVRELVLLRLPVAGECPLQGVIARRMWQACRPYADSFITPMAAVAGAVAQELIACYERRGVTRAWVNNGGDIALHLAPGQSLRVGLYADLGCFDLAQLREGLRTEAQFDIASALPVRGVATSGWRGRSFSLGIADSVTVLARSAAAADAAATVIANAVNAADPRIARRPACEIKDDSDLGSIPVTVDVPALEPERVAKALHAGLVRAQALRVSGLIWSAALVCQNQFVSTTSVQAVRLGAAQTRQKDAQTGLLLA